MVEMAIGLLVLVACALHHLHITETTNPNIDTSAIADLADSFSFKESQEKTMQTRFCSTLCDTISNKDTLLNSGRLILPIGGVNLFLTFSPTADATIRTSLPKEIRLALRIHKALFYRRELLLTVTSSIVTSPVFIFQIALLTLLCME